MIQSKRREAAGIDCAARSEMLIDAPDRTT
jgi:hypothetical protein